MAAAADETTEKFTEITDELIADANKAEVERGRKARGAVSLPSPASLVAG